MTEWDNIKVRDLQRFAAVIEAGSFTGAAAAMDESAKQLSRRVAALERQLGIRLFHRTTRSVNATIEGETWYVDVRAVLDRLQEATDAVRPSDHLAGLVRVQVPTVLIDIVQDWCAAQIQEHPRISLELIVGDRSDDLLVRGIDLCLSGVPPTGATLLVRKVGSAQPHLMAHRDYLDRRGRPKSPADLAHHECLRFIGPATQSCWVLNHEDGRVETVSLGGRFACNDSRALHRGLVDGMGIGPAIPSFRAGSVEAEVLELVLPGWTFGVMPMYLALAPGRSRLPVVRYVADALVALTQDAIRERTQTVERS